MVRQYLQPALVRRIESHRAQGHLVALLSSSTPYLATPLAEDLGIEHLLVSRLVIENGRFTGDVHRPICYGAGKIHWARRFAEEHDVDLAASWFYTDSVTDLPMLELVGHPEIVNPDPRLRREAKRRGWNIMQISPNEA
jgi:HAD superfamily hydrolase (TIGR01490 family)